MKPRSFVILFACFGVLLGCTRFPSVTTHAGGFSRQFTKIDQYNVSSLVEVLDIPSTVKGNDVIGINFNPSTDRLIIVYSPDGRTKIWDIDALKLLHEFTINISSSSNVSFDSRGENIVGSMYSEVKDDGFFNKEYLGGIGAWNANTGDLVLCIEMTCDATKGITDREPVFALSSPIGFTVDPTGEWALIYGMRFMKYANLRTKDISSITYGTQKGEDLTLIGNVAFDSQGKQIAIAYQEGGVVIQKFPAPVVDLFSTTVQENQNEKNCFPVPALSFSPDNKWLARIYQDKLTVWNVEKQQGAFIIEPMNDAIMLSFDPSSKFLFVAATNEIAVMSLENGERIKSYHTAKISYMTISADGKFVIWGDQQGNVHFLGGSRK